MPSAAGKRVGRVLSGCSKPEAGDKPCSTTWQVILGFSQYSCIGQPEVSGVYTGHAIDLVSRHSIDSISIPYLKWYTRDSRTHVHLLPTNTFYLVPFYLVST